MVVELRGYLLVQLRVYFANLSRAFWSFYWLRIWSNLWDIIWPYNECLFGSAIEHLFGHLFKRILALNSIIFCHRFLGLFGSNINEYLAELLRTFLAKQLRMYMAIKWMNIWFHIWMIFWSVLRAYLADNCAFDWPMNWEPF